MNNGGAEVNCFFCEDLLRMDSVNFFCKEDLYYTLSSVHPKTGSIAVCCVCILRELQALIPSLMKVLSNESNPKCVDCFSCNKPFINTLPAHASRPKTLDFMLISKIEGRVGGSSLGYFCSLCSQDLFSI
jgi:hypothetical protein